MGEAVADPSLKPSRLGTQGDHLYWYFGDQTVIFLPARHFDAKQHGVGYKKEAMDIALLFMKMFTSDPSKQLRVEGQPWDLLSESGPHLEKDPDIKVHVITSLAETLEGLAGSRPVRVVDQLDEQKIAKDTSAFKHYLKDHVVTITPIEMGDKTLVVDRHTSVMRSRRETPGIPWPVEKRYGRKVVEIKWVNVAPEIKRKSPKKK